MRQRTWSEPLQSHRDEPDSPTAANTRSSNRPTGRPIAVGALALIAAAVIVAVLAAAL